MATAATRLAAFTAGLRTADLPPGVAAAARLHLLDALGCGLAAHATGEGAFAHAAAVEGGGGRGGDGVAIGMAGGLPAADAALLNGTLCHALDFDDTHPHSVVHVSAVVVPAALAVAAAGEELVAALVAGNEVATRVGMAAGGRFHARGLHATGVCGVFGAAAAAARARGLDAQRTAHALGIAGSLAGGLLEFLADGAMTKPMHAGFAARAGVDAARLAAHGATGPATVLEGRRGFLGAYLHGEEFDAGALTAGLGERWETQRIAFKPYPACHYVHAPLDALAALVAEHGVQPEDVEGITAFTDATGVGMVLEPAADKLRPRTPYDAKFSLPYCLGALLVHGRVGVESFAPGAIADPRVLELAARVRYEQREYAPAPDSFGGGVRVATRDGRVLEAELRHQRGGAEHPMAEDEVVAKYRANAGLALERDDVDAVQRAALHGGWGGLTALANAGAS